LDKKVKALILLGAHDFHGSSFREFVQGVRVGVHVTSIAKTKVHAVEEATAFYDNG
jgi:hypothetical protein